MSIEQHLQTLSPAAEQAYTLALLEQLAPHLGAQVSADAERMLEFCWGLFSGPHLDFEAAWAFHYTLDDILDAMHQAAAEQADRMECFAAAPFSFLRALGSYDAGARAQGRPRFALFNAPGRELFARRRRARRETRRPPLRQNGALNAR